MKYNASTSLVLLLKPIYSQLLDWFFKNPLHYDSQIVATYKSKLVKN